MTARTHGRTAPAAHRTRVLRQSPWNVADLNMGIFAHDLDNMTP
jgi:hypothetical protein